ncbi:unnamed protein product [Sphenostylis stenocarpa]|uniref:Uncharacterized protein n=1 Tax=Sphenostylis stenocarpa TaxID=92480 RepID=A0AA86T0F1_9FABA|nr:unnamed protein product [Sphenostylis stenocarpa]
MVGLVGVATVVCMHEKRSIIPLHNQLCMATIISAWRMVGAKKQLHDNLCMAISGGDVVGSSPAAINFSVTLSHQQLAWYLVGGTPRLYLRGIVKFAVSLSYKELRSYLLPQVWFICCFPWLQPRNRFYSVLYSMHG